MYVCQMIDQTDVSKVIIMTTLTLMTNLININQGCTNAPKRCGTPPSVKELSLTESQNDKFNQKANVRIRPKFDKISWDSMSSTFAKFKKLLEGHLNQVGAGYLIESRFYKVYLHFGVEYFKSDQFWHTHRISEYQAA